MSEKMYIESTAYLSNEGIYLYQDESFLLTSYHTKIKVDFSDDLSEEELADGLYKIEEVGNIYHYQFNLDYSEDNLAILADAKSSDLCYAASFFFYEEGKGYLSSRHLFYIDKVFIKPEYRGHGYAITALAMLLQHFAYGETVCCHPCPIADLQDRYSEDKGKFLMRRYWLKVGFESYSAKHNILWADAWTMPDWLRETILSD